MGILNHGIPIQSRDSYHATTSASWRRWATRSLSNPPPDQRHRLCLDRLRYAPPGTAACPLRWSFSGQSTPREVGGDSCRSRGLTMRSAHTAARHGASAGRGWTPCPPPFLGPPREVPHAEVQHVPGDVVGVLVWSGAGRLRGEVAGRPWTAGMQGSAPSPAARTRSRSVLMPASPPCSTTTSEPIVCSCIRSAALARVSAGSTVTVSGRYRFLILLADLPSGHATGFLRRAALLLDAHRRRLPGRHLHRARAC